MQTKSLRLVLFALGISALLLTLTVATRTAALAAPEAALYWEIHKIDGGTNDVGVRPSIAIKPGGAGMQGGQPFISYYDYTNKHLRLAYYTGPGQGACDFGWHCYNADSDTGTGQYSSMVFAANGIGYIGYTHQGEGIDKYTLQDNLTGSTSAWSGASNSRFPTVAMRTGTEPMMAFYDWCKCSDGYNAEMLYADNSGGNWIYDVKTYGSPSTTGYFASMGRNFVNNVSAIAYRGQGTKAFPLNNTLNYMQEVPQLNDTCGVDSVYYFCSMVDSVPETGNYISLYEPKAGGQQTQIAYYDGTNYTLKYAKYTGANVTCGLAGFAKTGWTCESIESIGKDDGMLGVSLGMWNSAPVIAYTDRDDQANAVLKVARYVGAGGTGCNKSTKWTCTIVDDGDWFGQTSIHSVGGFASLAIGTDGRLHIAEYDTTTYDLKIAEQKADQTINFAALPDIANNTPPFTVNATTSSGLTVYFTASGVCSATGAYGKTITHNNTGTCTVTAHQDGNNYWHQAGNVARTFKVTSAQPVPTNTPTPKPTSTPAAGCNKAPNASAMLEPLNKAKVAAGTIYLKWSAVSCTTEYTMTIKKLVIKNGKKSKKHFEDVSGGITEWATKKPGTPGRYFWNVKTCNAVGCSTSSTHKFKIKKP